MNFVEVEVNVLLILLFALMCMCLIAAISSSGKEKIAKDAYELGYERGRQAEKINLVADLEKYSVDIYSEAGECWERYVYLDTVKKIVKGEAEC